MMAYEAFQVISAAILLAMFAAWLAWRGIRAQQQERRDAEAFRLEVEARQREFLEDGDDDL
jgi:ABC-type nickel/cobalt efflux system permease component RcnA